MFAEVKNADPNPHPSATPLNLIHVAKRFPFNPIVNDEPAKSIHAFW
jgi:hypothetical protein